MSLSNILFDHVAQKLKLEETLKLAEETIYAKKLLTKVSFLKDLKKKNYKNLSLKKYSNKTFEDFLIMYIVSVSFLKANTIIHISDTKGNIKLFYTAGAANLIGKQKRQRRTAVSRLMSLIIKKTEFIGKKPIALHLNNVTSHKRLIVSRLKRTFFVKIIKSFNQTPFNGCRKKKIRRKKNTKLIKI